ncbi:uncharacterized protein B0H64DRAFT_165395 [Chaetomium fimeti]|uniref:Uncharacterized protein n=1 Tax=Chaetomium fimeti TaxID=1854472 RepID=A0AAE0LST0_9PEZI|nr:hypothetical protein B0H64DRAFT_165395 [Chaetomium fimeti]
MTPARPETGSPAVSSSASSAPNSPGVLRSRKLSDRANIGGMRRSSTAGPLEPGPGIAPENYIHRRSSTFSQYSINEAVHDFQEEIADPGPDVNREPTTWKSLLPIIFASVPPIAGLFFTNGSAFFSDLILLFLATVFLHWSITAPWKWYNLAQQVRADNEPAFEESLKAQGDESPTKPGSDSESLNGPHRPKADKYDRTRQADAALDRLQSLETMALATCFLAPAFATYLLYSVRYLLSPPSESLVSSFNVAIFLMAAEIPPLSHSIRLILARTLHLQRIVNTNPYRVVPVTASNYRELLARVKELEARTLEQSGRARCEGCDCIDSQKKQHAARQLREDVTRDVRAAVGPEIDGVIRAVRRYERKTSTLTDETERRLADLRQRLDDVIALSAVAARNNAGGWGFLGTLAAAGWLALSFPVAAALTLASLLLAPLAKPLNWISSQGRRVRAEAEARDQGRWRKTIGNGQAQENGQPRARSSRQGRSVSTSSAVAPPRSSRMKSG